MLNKISATVCNRYYANPYYECNDSTVTNLRSIFGIMFICIIGFTSIPLKSPMYNIL